MTTNTSQQDDALIFGANLTADDNFGGDDAGDTEDPSGPNRPSDGHTPRHAQHHSRHFDVPRPMERPRQPAPTHPQPSQVVVSPHRLPLTRLTPATRKRDRDMITATLGDD